MDVAISALKKLGEAAVDAAKYSVEVGSNFEEAMSKVSALSGSAGSDLTKLEDKAKELGSSTKFSATEVAEGFSYMSLAGWDTASMLDGIDGVLNLAAASEMELADASDMVTDYLSAFGMQASESSKMADMLAYAQANSNTSATQLGEAYGNCAANLHTAGQDIETVTSLLEAMANQGTKGSEAGTQLSSIMSQITQKMQDGAIAIGDTSVAVADSNGDFRDLTDILKDVEAATEGMGTEEKSAALAATFNKTALSGVNQILTEGMDKVSGYEGALRDSDGAASDMADTMQNNLKGKITALDSALEGLGIAAYNKVSGPLTKVVGGVTELIGGITNCLESEKTELEQFIDDIEESNNKVTSMVQNAKDTISGSDEEIADLEAYRDILMEVADAEEASEWQKYELKNIVDELGDSIPELKDAYNEQTGAISLNADEIDNLLSKQMELVKQQAYVEAATEAEKALAEAKINVAKAESAAKQASDEYTTAMEENASSAKSGAYAINGMSKEAAEASRENAAAAKAQTEANEALEEAQKEYDTTQDALENLGIDLEQYKNSAQDAADATTETTTQISEAYETMNEAVADAAENVSNIFDEYEEETLNPEDILKNMEDQAKAFEDWKDNLAELAGKAGESMSEELYNYLAEMGPEGASYVAAFTDMTDEELKEASDAFAKRTDSIANVTEENMEKTEEAVEDSVSNIQDAAEGTSDCYDAIKDAFDKAAKEAESGGNAIAESTKNSFEDAVNNAQKAGVEIPEGLAEGIRSGKTSPQEAIDTINASIADKGSELTATAKEMGIEIPDSVKEGIEAGGQKAVEAIETINKLIQKKQEEQNKSSKESGEKSSKEYSKGQKAGKGSVAKEAGNTAEAGAKSANAKRGQYNAAGYNAAKGYARGIENGTNAAVNAAAAMAAKSIAAANKKNDSHSPSRVYKKMGQYVTEGYSLGIQSGTKDAKKAASSMAAASLQAAKDELEIKSPSKKFRKSVGQQVGKGFAFGIKDTSSLAGKEAEKMSSNVYTKAAAWLKKYKEKQKVSLADEKYYWQQVAAHTKKGTDAYNKAIAKMLAASVSKTTTTGSGKNKKTKNKSAETYYSEIYSAAQKYATNQQILNDWSLKRQLSYWEAVKKQLKKGTQAWYDATKEINELKTEIEEAAKEKLQTQLSVQKDALSKYKIYNKLSAKAEMQYWDIARKQFKAGTDERIEADQMYLEAKEEYYDQLTELKEDYAEKEQEIDDELKESIKDLQDTYDETLSNSKKEILSSMSLFESWDASGYTKDVLTANLKTQVEGLKFWEEQLEELSNKNISQGLIDELTEMGPEAAASLWSLNQMTAEELEEYDKLWTEKNNLAQKQAEENNKSLLKETTDAIEEAKKKAEEEIAELTKEYNSSVADLNTGLSKGLKSLVTQAGKIGEDIVSALINGINKANSDSAAQKAVSSIISSQTKTSSSSTSSKSTSKSTSKTSSSTKTSDKIKAAIQSGTKRSKKLTSEDKKNHAELWEYIVKNYGYAPNNSVYKSLASQLGVKVSSKVTGEQKAKILKKLKAKGYATGKKKFEEDGEYWLHEGELLVRKSDNGILKTMNAGEGVIPADLTENLMKWGEQTPEEFLNSQRALNTSGIGRLNKIMEQTPQQTNVINIDNSDIADLMQEMMSGMENMVEAISGMQIVTDTGVLAGEMQSKISRENAAVTIRRNRGRLP
jgi:TP901 family phage tail tape measure protein